MSNLGKLNLSSPGRRGGEFVGLVQNLFRKSQQWQKLDKQIKQLLPANLRLHIQTACVRDGILILAAANNMAASRLKMILPVLMLQVQQLDDRISEVKIKVIPKTPQPVKENSLRLPESALDAFDDAAAQLKNRHPSLAQALSDLSEKHRNRNKY